MYKYYRNLSPEKILSRIRTHDPWNPIASFTNYKTNQFTTFLELGLINRTTYGGHWYLQAELLSKYSSHYMRTHCFFVRLFSGSPGGSPFKFAFWGVLPFSFFFLKLSRCFIPFFGDLTGRSSVAAVSGFESELGGGRVCL